MREVIYKVLAVKDSAWGVGQIDPHSFIVEMPPLRWQSQKEIEIELKISENVEIFIQ